MATVAQIVVLFLKQNPEILIYATGSTETRTRLYQIGISNLLPEINHEFEIYGVIGDSIAPFEKGIAYEGFVVRLKNANSLL